VYKVHPISTGAMNSKGGLWSRVEDSLMKSMPIDGVAVTLAEYQHIPRFYIKSDKGFLACVGYLA